jgi:cation:H+ antiporter
MALVLLLPLILVLIGNTLSRIDGAILVAVFVVYSWYLMKQKRKFTKQVKDNIKRSAVVLNTLLFAGSLALLFISSHFVVKYATSLSFDLALPPFIVGLFLVSFGTTLPELTFEARAVMSKHSQMALGDLIGTLVVNTTLVLGIAALILPIKIQLDSFLLGAIFMVIVAFLFAAFFKTGNKLSVKEGIVLILLYVIYVIIQFSLN